MIQYALTSADCVGVLSACSGRAKEGQQGLAGGKPSQQGSTDSVYCVQTVFPSPKAIFTDQIDRFSKHTAFWSRGFS